MTREGASIYFKNHIESFCVTGKCREAEKMEIKALEQEPIIDKMRAEITTLQNRCYALTKGTMCAFCKYECKYKAETEADNG